MTNEELLSPRYKVIAGYPGSLYPTGYIIDEADNLEGFTFFSTEVHKYPHIFKPLAWYEEREEKDMPSYVRNVADGIVFKVYARFKKAPSSIQVKAKGSKYATWHALCDLIPATEAEYNNQNQ